MAAPLTPGSPPHPLPRGTAGLPLGSPAPSGHRQTVCVHPRAPLQTARGCAGLRGAGGPAGRAGAAGSQALPARRRCRAGVPLRASPAVFILLFFGLGLVGVFFLVVVFLLLLGFWGFFSPFPFLAGLTDFQAGALPHARISATCRSQPELLGATFCADYSLYFFFFFPWDYIHIDGQSYFQVANE